MTNAVRQAKYRNKHPERVRAVNRRMHMERKTKCLTHYGKDGTLQCCWPACTITDIDMLTLDHINDDGATHRKTLGGNGSGSHIYRWIIRSNYPEGFQTLCWNHQWKKRIEKAKKTWL